MFAVLRQRALLSLYRSSLPEQDWSIHQDLVNGAEDPSGTSLSEWRLVCRINNLLYWRRRKTSQVST